HQLLATDIQSAFAEGPRPMPKELPGAMYSAAPTDTSGRGLPPAWSSTAPQPIGVGHVAVVAMVAHLPASRPRLVGTPGTLAIQSGEGEGTTERLLGLWQTVLVLLAGHLGHLFTGLAHLLGHVSHVQAAVLAESPRVAGSHLAQHK